MDLTGKVAVITGASRGIGQSIAHTLGKAGATVCLIARKKEALEAFQQNLHQEGISALSLVADVTRAEEVQACVQKIRETYEQLHILVNNAGISRDRLLAMTSESDWDEVLNTNLKGVYLLTKALVRYLSKSQGTIVNISSVIGLTGNTGQAAYAASKAGIIAFTKSVAKEYAKRGLRANVIAPGFIQTQMTDALEENVKAEILQRIPLNRFGTVEDVSQLTLFLCSDLSRYITGQVFVVDGGLTM
jgi:3-oxoacyl-[acyl-carrier protein] reductase